MATNTYVALDKITVSGTSTTSVTITGISGSYTDLKLVINSQNQNNTYQPYIQFNSDTGTGTSNYSTISVRANSSGPNYGQHTNQIGWYPAPGPGVGTTGNFQTWTINIKNYSSTSKLKTGISRFNNAASIVTANTHLWNSTAAITSITITAESGSGYIAPGSTFSLYGILAAPVLSAKATGGTISYDPDGYVIHTFTSTGNFVPSQSLTNVDFLVVGGGGGSSVYQIGGGGGAGGYRTSVGQSGGGASAESKLSLASGTTYVATIGGGSTGNGTASSLIGGAVSITSTGGGGTTGDTGSSGGSGSGGSAYNNNPTYAAGAGTSGQGYAGGTGLTDRYSTAVWRVAGPGGGAGAAGVTVNDNSGIIPNATSHGGVGLQSDIDGIWRGGGGGGGLQYATINTGYNNGGKGGGGYGGGYFGAGQAGTANTGGGGGGVGYATGGDGVSASGGSGIVLIRYAG